MNARPPSSNPSNPSNPVDGWVGLDALDGLDESLSQIFCKFTQRTHKCYFTRKTRQKYTQIMERVLSTPEMTFQTQDQDSLTAECAFRQCLLNEQCTSTKLNFRSKVAHWNQIATSMVT